MPRASRDREWHDTAPPIPAPSLEVGHAGSSATFLLLAHVNSEQLLRLVAVWALFLHGCSEVSKQRANDNRVMSFMTSLKAFGSLFILAVPTVVTFASLVIAP